MRTNLFPIIGLSILTGFVPVDSARAQKAKPKPPVKKSGAAKPAIANKPAAAKNGPIVLGTTQLPGDFGQFGQTYTIGKQNPINVTLRSAEYTTARFNVGENTRIPTSEQKLLAVHYTIHNPNPAELRFYWNSLRFTAVDSKDVNHEDLEAVTREGTSEPVDLSLKPAQKLEVQSVLLVPAAGVIPKLILRRAEGEPVIRYDLRGKVSPLPAPIADPADTTGATALRNSPANFGIYYPCGNFDIKVESAAYTRKPLGDGDTAQAPEDGKRYITVTFAIRNATNAEKRYYWATFVPELRDADGDQAEFPQVLIKASRNEAAEGSLKPGEEARVRLFFVLPDEVAAKTLTLAEVVDTEPSHGYLFDLSTAK